tara:strand:- start:57 stop:1127 length:1071 start_codon:yes stop_codon:yes gene_type:complete
MIKLYDLVFEAKKETKRQPNFAADKLGDKNEEFESKLALISPEASNKLIAEVNRLKGSQLEEFKNLLNKYSNIEDLKGPRTPLEKKIAIITPGNTGPGEILFHLELQDSTMLTKGITSHDLIVKGKIWEVKMVNERRNFRLAPKEGSIGKYKVGRDLYKMVELLDKVTELLPELEEDFQDISPRLLKALRLWNTVVTTKYTPREAIFQGGHSDKFRDAMLEIITAVKDEIKINTDDEFTTVKFGGVNVTPKDKGIDPISIQNIGDDSITLNFISQKTINILEILNELPYANDGDFELSFSKDVLEKALENFPSMVIFSMEGNIAIIEEKELANKLEFDEVAQNVVSLKIKPEHFQK